MLASGGSSRRDQHFTGYPMWLIGGGVKADTLCVASGVFGTRLVVGRMYTKMPQSTLLDAGSLNGE